MKKMIIKSLVLLPLLLACAAWKMPAFSKTDTTVRPANDSFEVHKITSEYQGGEQLIRVVKPDNYSASGKYRVLYVLPVGQAARRSILPFFKEMGIHNRYNLILVEMTFEKTPWYGDHATDKKVRQESYMREVVVPFVDKKYATLSNREGRILIGFSKSGWGAFSLIFRNADLYGYAVAWDTPWMMDTFHFKTDEVFGTLEQMNKYRPDLLVPQVRKLFKKKNRLVLGGEDIWGKSLPPKSGLSHTEDFHLLLDSNRIKHSYRNDLKVKHSWSKVWIEPMMEEVMKLVDQ